MKVLEINVCSGCLSTGKLAIESAREYEAQGYKAVVAYGRENVDAGIETYKIGNRLNVLTDVLKSRLFDNAGFNSKGATRKFLNWATEYDPDILVMHNLHGYYLNVEMLFDWIKSRPEMKVYWMLYDCWAFTGHCVHFAVEGCCKWKSGCGDCPLKGNYPASLVDRSADNFRRKSQCFTGVRDMTIVVPSRWMEKFIRDSFLRDYPVEIRPNQVNRQVFKPTSGNFREKYGLEDKIVLLGVASAWSEKKGLGDFIKLSSMLGEKYAIVLVGITPAQARKIPDRILTIPRTDSAEELASIYTDADLFINPSREESFGMTTVEARCCGTDVIVYKDTACEEVIESTGGVAVDQGVDFLYKAVTERFGE